MFQQKENSETHLAVWDQVMGGVFQEAEAGFFEARPRLCHCNAAVLGARGPNRDAEGPHGLLDTGLAPETDSLSGAGDWTWTTSLRETIRERHTEWG